VEISAAKNAEVNQLMSLKLEGSVG
jgi:hypothetical protein